MKHQAQQRIRGFWLLLAMTVGSASLVHSQSSEAVQVLTLSVKELNSVLIPVQTIDLRLEERSEQEQVAKAVTTFVWTSNADSRKIAVSSPDVRPATKLRIRVQDVGWIRGLRDSEVELKSPIPLDLIRAAEMSAGSCTVEFRVLTSRAYSTEKSMISVFYTVTSG